LTDFFLGQMAKLRFREIALMRMRNQRLTGPPAATPAEVVRQLGAVQAQDFYGSLWAIGQRTEGASKAAIDSAIAQRQIVRSWPMRGTLHFVAAEDLRWMLRVLAPRILKQHATRLQRDLELDAKSLAAARRVVVRELEGGGQRTRPELYQALEHAGVYAGGSRGIHIFWMLAHEGVICFGPHAGRQPTVVLLDEWLPAGRRLEGEEALAELALRYFKSHGPATIKDFIWWTGLAAAEAKSGLELIKDRLESIEADGNCFWHSGEQLSPPKETGSRVDLLPAYDEFTVGYADRLPITAWSKQPIGRGTTIFNPVIVKDGQVVGAWKRIDEKGLVRVKAQMFPGASALSQRSREIAMRRYGSFLGLPVAWETATSGVIRGIQSKADG
jgi:hypothetical protein